MDMKNYIIAVKYRIVWSESAKLLSWKQISIVFFCILCGIQLIHFTLFSSISIIPMMHELEEHQLTFVSNFIVDSPSNTQK